MEFVDWIHLLQNRNRWWARHVNELSNTIEDGEFSNCRNGCQLFEDFATWRYLS